MPRLTAAENSPAMGENEIEALTEKYGPVSARAMRVASCMVERGNVLRRALVEAIDSAELAAAQQQNLEAETQAASNGRPAPGTHYEYCIDLHQPVNSIAQAGELGGSPQALGRGARYVAAQRHVRCR